MDENLMVADPSKASFVPTYCAPMLVKVRVRLTTESGR
jgi:hypothetical protein